MADRRQILESARDELVKRLGDRGSCDNEDHGRVSDVALPGLIRELRQVLAELDGIPTGNAKAPADEIAKRRTKRRQEAATG
ncbi:hypothetical protein [Staphylococcus capitis]|uniref:hypothetical protein n=1 Tax=Staphylococcus capitis TaxID=29388 RepID=UPI003D01C22C